MRLRTIVRALFLDLLVLLAACASAPARSVESVGLTVSSLERSTAFFHETLQFEIVALRASDDGATRTARMRLGDETLDLTERAGAPGRPIPADSRSDDLWFQHVAIIVRDMDAAYARLRDAGVAAISRAPQRLPDWNPSAGGIRAFYFRDPDGHPLEILQFPPDKGDVKWRRRTDRLFLGIDHTAIAVSDTDRSLGFWRDQLGLRVVGTSDNHGPEQEALSGVAGAHVRITSLRADSGPGVEFLEYLAPRGGRRLDDAPQSGDLAFWRVVVRVGDATRAGLVRDPDGHAIETVAAP